MNKKKGVYISIPVRLGLDNIAIEYLEVLKQVFSFEASLGISGG